MYKAKILASILTVWTCCVAGARAQETGLGAAGHRAVSFDSLEAVKDSDLSDMRGGYITANGANFDFGATVKTLVNGELALQSTIQWTPTGVAVQQVPGTIPNAAAIAPSELAKLTGRSPDATGPSTGVRITAPSGTTDVIANFAGGRVQNMLLNTASNQTVMQDTAITLTVYNFSAWQQQLAQHLVSTRLANELMTSLSLGVRH